MGLVFSKWQIMPLRRLLQKPQLQRFIYLMLLVVDLQLLWVYTSIQVDGVNY